MGDLCPAHSIQWSGKKGEICNFRKENMNPNKLTYRVQWLDHLAEWLVWNPMNYKQGREFEQEPHYLLNSRLDAGFLIQITNLAAQSVSSHPFLETKQCALFKIHKALFKTCSTSSLLKNNTGHSIHYFYIATVKPSWERTSRTPCADCR